MTMAGSSRKRFTGRKVSLTISGWIIGAVFIIPYLYMLITALKPKSEITKIPIDYLPSQWTWKNFTEVWHVLPLAGYLKSSFFVAFAATLVVLVFAVPAAYYVARNKFRGRTAFLMLVLITQMFSPTALVVGIFREMIKFHLVDT